MATEPSVFRVANHSNPKLVAGSIAHAIRQHERVDVRAIGMGAVYQALKAVILARDYLAEDKPYLCAVPSFVATQIDGEERTAIEISIQGCIGICGCQTALRSETTGG